MIKIKGLDKYLGGVKILDNINIHVKAGSIYGLIGPNGAGKTTLLKCLVDIYEPERGEVTISGEKIKDNKKIKYLSKGMKTQLAILLSLSVMPEVLVLDEPTSGLDPVVMRKVLNLIVEEVSTNKTTVMISSHNLGQLEQICDHIGIIHEGRILLEDSIENLKSKVRKIQTSLGYLSY